MHSTWNKRWWLIVSAGLWLVMNLIFWTLNTVAPPYSLLSKGALTDFQVCKDKTTPLQSIYETTQRLRAEELSNQTVYLCGQVMTDERGAFLLFLIRKGKEVIFYEESQLHFAGVFYEPLSGDMLSAPGRYRIGVYSGRELLAEFLLVVEAK